MRGHLALAKPSAAGGGVCGRALLCLLLLLLCADLLVPLNKVEQGLVFPRQCRQFLLHLLAEETNLCSLHRSSHTNTGKPENPKA